MLHTLLLSTHSSYLKQDILELHTDIIFKTSLTTSSFVLKNKLDKNNKIRNILIVNKLPFEGSYFSFF